MLFGNPSKFAIFWDVVPAWSNENQKNGLLNIYVNFTLLGNRKDIVHPLGPNLYDLLLREKAHKFQPAIPAEFTNLTPTEVFSWLCEFTFPKHDIGQDSNSCYLAVPSAVYDDGDVLFLVKKTDKDHLFYGRYDGSYKGSIDLPLDEFGNAVKEAFSAFENL